MALAFGACGGRPAEAVLLLNDLIARHHRLEVVPAGPDDLGDVDHEESAIAMVSQKWKNRAIVYPPKEVPIHPNWTRLIDGESGQDGAGAHQDDARIGDLLGPVELAARRSHTGQVQVVQHDLERLPQRLPVGHQRSPLS